MNKDQREERLFQEQVKEHKRQAHPEPMKRKNAPYTFKGFLIAQYGTEENIPDTAPELLYDGYAYSLEQLGYKVYGNCYTGITVS